MNDRKEIIEMLYLLKNNAKRVSNEKNTTVITDVNPESFDWVITSAIAKLKEDGNSWELLTPEDRKRKHEEFKKEFRTYLKKKREEEKTEWRDI